MILNDESNLFPVVAMSAFVISAVGNMTIGKQYYRSHNNKDLMKYI